MSLTLARLHEIYPDNQLQLGLGHRLRFTSTRDDFVVGAIHEHPRQRPPDHGPNRDYHADDFSCSSSLWFDVPEASEFGDRPRWHIDSLTPLTLTPSVRCSACGVHGFIINSAWVAA